MGLSPGAPRGAPEARANLSASGGKGNTAKSKIVSIAPPLLSPASGGKSPPKARRAPPSAVSAKVG